MRKVISTLKRSWPKIRPIPHYRHDRTGLFKMTRRIRYGISEFFTDECAACNGRGRNLSLAPFL